MYDHQLHLARNGDHSDHFKQFFLTDDPVELLEELDPQSARDQRGRGKSDIVVCLDGTWNENETQDTNVS